MNKDANLFRLRATNEIMSQLVAQGYTFFSNVYLHSDYNEVSAAFPVGYDREVWSDHMFFTIPGKALILRISLNYKETDSTKLILSFRLLASAKPLRQLNAIAEEQGLALLTVPLDDKALDHFSQPRIPVFVTKNRPQEFGSCRREHWFEDVEDSWVVGVSATRTVKEVSSTYSQVAEGLTTWIAPMLPYVNDGKLDIPKHSGLTTDPNFLRSEQAMRERLNLRTLREIANFGKLL